MVDITQMDDFKTMHEVNTNIGKFEVFEVYAKEANNADTIDIVTT